MTIRTNKPMDLSGLHKKALPIYGKASAIALENFRKNIGYKIKVDKSGLKSVVTKVDKEIGSLLTKELTKILPGSGFLSEEEPEALGGKYNWIIDPIDGTANYQKGVDLWGIFISLKNGGETVYAATLFPTLMCKMIYGIKGKGVFDNRNKKMTLGVSTGYKAKFSVDSTEKQFKTDVSALDFGFKTSYMKPGSVAFNSYSFLRGAYEFMVIYKLDLYDFDAIAFLANELGARVVFIKGFVDKNKLVNNGLEYALLISRKEIYDKVNKKIRNIISKYEK